MADPLCRWRNFTPETICEIVKSLPKDVMPINAFRSYMANSIWTSDFFRTAYQYACQLALYYEDKQAPACLFQDSTKILLHPTSPHFSGLSQLLQSATSLRPPHQAVCFACGYQWYG